MGAPVLGILKSITIPFRNTNWLFLESYRAREKLVSLRLGPSQCSPSSFFLTGPQFFNILYVDLGIYEFVAVDQALPSTDRRREQPPSCVCGALGPRTQLLAPARRMYGVRCTRMRCVSTPCNPETHPHRHALSSPPNTRPVPTLLPLRRRGASCI